MTDGAQIICVRFISETHGITVLCADHRCHLDWGRTV